MKRNLTILTIFIIINSLRTHALTLYYSNNDAEKTKVITGCYHSPLPPNQFKYCFVKGTLKTRTEGSLAIDLYSYLFLTQTIVNHQNFSVAEEICGESYDDLSETGISSLVELTKKEEKRAQQSCTAKRTVEIAKYYAEPASGNTKVIKINSELEMPEVSISNSVANGPGGTQNAIAPNCRVTHTEGVGIDVAAQTCRAINGTTELYKCQPGRFQTNLYSCECTICYQN